MKNVKTNKTTATVNTQAPTTKSVNPESGTTPQITLQANYVSEYGICGDPYMTDPFDFFAEDTSSPVCMVCAAKFAPDLLRVHEAAFGSAGATLGENLYGSLDQLKGSLDNIYSFAIFAKEQTSKPESDGICHHCLGVVFSMLEVLRNRIDRSLQDVRKNACDMAREPFQISVNHKVNRSFMDGEDECREAPEMRS